MIGVFDSGIGGLSILREVVKTLPAEDVFSLSDHYHLPYGGRSFDEIRQLSFAVVDFFLARQVKLVVIACNTASAAALYALRHRHPELPIVGMEPAVKPAVEASRSGTIGVLATRGTFEGMPYAGVVERFAEGVRVIPQVCPGLVELIEAYLGGDSSVRIEIRRRLSDWLTPLREAGVDHLVLGCTHYPLIRDLIKEEAGDGITLVEPSRAVAAQAERLLREHSLLSSSANRGKVTFFSTGSDLALFARQVTAAGLSVHECRRLIWQEGALCIA